MGSYLAQRLKDPQSAQITYGRVVKGWMYEAKGLQFGYLFSVTLNAKNSFGAYTGRRTTVYLLHDKKPVAGWSDALPLWTFEGGTADGQPYRVGN